MEVEGYYPSDLLSSKLTIMERVISKNLFHYQLDGVLCEEGELMQKSMEEAAANNPQGKEMMELMKGPEENITEQMVVDTMKGGNKLFLFPSFLKKVKASTCISFH